MDATITGLATTATPKAVPISGPAAAFDAHAAVPDARTHRGIVHARMDPSTATENDAREPSGVLNARTTQVLWRGFVVLVPRGSVLGGNESFRRRTDR